MNKQKENELVPRLRFPEFRDAVEWKTKSLKKLLVFTDRKVKKPETPYTRLGIRSHGKGTFLVFNESPEKNAMEFLYKVKQNDLIVNITFAWEGAIAIASQKDEGALVSHRFPMYVFNESEAIPNFFRYLILDKNFIYKLGVISPGGAGRNRVLSKTDFLKLKVRIPKTQEQQKIADCLYSLDDLINAHIKKLDSLKAYKKGLMQNLFPVEGKTTPNLRFSKFQNSGEWESKDIDKIADIFKGKGVSKADIVLQGRIPCIRYGELYTYYSEVINSIVSRTNVSKSKLFLSKKNDVIIPASGETKWDIATAACVLLDGVALGSDLNVIRSKENGVFISYYLNGVKRFKISKIAQGDTVVHLYSSQLKQLNLFFPRNSKEQQKIADCLSSVDELINAQSQKIDELKAHKKGLMQQLFPNMDED